MRALRCTAVCVVLTLAIACATAPVRHQAHLSLNAFAKGLAGVQQGELALYQAGKVSETSHLMIKGKILKIATMADEAQTALDAWVPGQPAPKVLAPIMVAAKDLMHDILTLVPMTDTLRQQVESVYDAIADVLILVTG